MSRKICYPKSMRRFTLSLCLLLLLCAQTAEAQRCFDWPAIYQANRSIFTPESSEQKILILPFINKTEDMELQWIGDAMRLGLFLSLEDASDGNVIEQRSKQVSFETEEIVSLGMKAGADYVIAGEFDTKKDTLIVFTRFVSVAKQESISLEENEIEWPNMEKYAELLIHLARRASKAFEKIRVDHKLLKNSKNNPGSVFALYYWTLGQLSEEKASLKDIQKAKENFESAIKNDFNYCYGYLGLAQALAELGFANKLRGRKYREDMQSAQRELSKASLLCPDTGKRWAKRVSQYLEADILQKSGEDLLNKGQRQEGTEKLKAALELLPGDLSSLKLLGSDPERVRSLQRCR